VLSHSAVHVICTDVAEIAVSRVFCAVAPPIVSMNVLPLPFSVNTQWQTQEEARRCVPGLQLCRGRAVHFVCAGIAQIPVSQGVLRGGQAGCQHERAGGRLHCAADLIGNIRIPLLVFHFC